MSLLATLSSLSIEWIDRIRQHSSLLGWALAASLVLSVGSVFLMRKLLIAMPADYFARSGPGPWELQHPLIRWSLVVGKNLLGAILLVAGVWMLVAPGQGMLTILAAILLLDFPGKRALERRVLALPAVRHMVDRIRHRAGQPPLELPHRQQATTGKS